MALGGYKRVALAAFLGRKRAQERDKPRQPQEQIVNRTQPSSDPDPEQAKQDEAAHTKVKSRAAILHEKEKRRRKKANQRQREKEQSRIHRQERCLNRPQSGSKVAREQIKSEEAVITNVPSCTAHSHKKEKQQRSNSEEQRLKDSEPSSEEKQRLQNEENKRLKKLKKRQKRRKRIDRQTEELQEQSFGTTEDPSNVPEGAAHGSPEVGDFADSHNSSDRVEEVDEGAKYDLAVKFRWVKLKNDIPEPIQDNFFDSAFEDDHQLRSKELKSRQEEFDAPKEPYPQPHRSPAHEEQPRTPTRSPPIQEPVTPNQPIRTPDVLVVTPSRRRPSPQLEYIVSPKSSALLQAAANMLVTLKSRTARLNAQIAAFNTQLLGLQTKQPSPSKRKLDDDSTSKAKILRKILRAMEKHSNQVFMMEFALRDLVDEGDEDLPKSLRETEVEFAKLVKTYEGRMHKLMRKLCPEALEMTLKEADDGLDKNM
ncbi:uncharacterized protein N0V89_012449 [Didymosphaeria variabile]|uniref:Uncharacterized protein n=1 Tax=Didymosphaeria variabile TaxID=1932322 RepID=A0A9W8X9Y5_9PLEO|nr:uncharacterized protein N0V89_012449 [Didymosphaeria variabile]KAJ4344705.1 hypothetical protein N0V89_012449 [Didymosphaeria variabile]